MAPRKFSVDKPRNGQLVPCSFGDCPQPCLLADTSAIQSPPSSAWVGKRSSERPDDTTQIMIGRVNDLERCLAHHPRPQQSVLIIAQARSESACRRPRASKPARCRRRSIGSGLPNRRRRWRPPRGRVATRHLELPVLTVGSPALGADHHVRAWLGGPGLGQQRPQPTLEMQIIRVDHVDPGKACLGQRKIARTARVPTTRLDYAQPQGPPRGCIRRPRPPYCPSMNGRPVSLRR